MTPAFPKHTVTTIILIVLSLSALSAQNTKHYIYGGIFDDLTRERLIGVKVELMDTNYITLDSMHTQSNVNIGDRMNGWYLPVESNTPYIVRFKMKGYEIEDIPVRPIKFMRRQRISFVKDVFMRKEIKKINLDEVTVQATKIKIYTKNDTIVYNADAFYVAEGSMLSELIKQLPGVELKENGEIFVEGEKVDNLLLNGEEFDSTDPQTLLQNLPSYYVKDVKVYDKMGEMSEFIGKSLGEDDKEYVMDVRLKKEYSIGWLANAEGAYGTANRYRGRFFGTRFSPQSRVTLFGNMNNLSENGQPADNGNWNGSQLNVGLQAGKTGGLTYAINEKDGRYKLSGGIMVRHFDSDVQTRTFGENFLTGGNTFNYNAHTERFCQTYLNTWHNWTFSINKNVRLKVEPSVSFINWDDRNDYLSGTFKENPVDYFNEYVWDSLGATNLGDVMRRIAINRGQSRQNNVGNWLRSTVYAESYIKLFGGTDGLYIKARHDYSDRSEKWYEHYLLDYPINGTADFRNRYINNQGPERDHHIYTAAEYWLWLPKNLAIVPSYGYHYQHTPRLYELFRLDQLADWGATDTPEMGMLPSDIDLLQSTLDAPNSYRSAKTWNAHCAQLYMKWEGQPKRLSKTYWNIEAWLPMNVHIDRLEYKQERIDTTVSRTSPFFEPRILIRGRWRENLQEFFYFEYSGKGSTTDMTNLINLKNTSDPLNIRYSNPALKNSYLHQAWMTFSFRNKDKGRMTRINFSGSTRQNAVAQGYIYDKNTGTRTYRPENVNGNYNVKTSLYYYQPLDKAKRLDLTLNVGTGFNNSVDLIGAEGSVPQRSTVKRLTGNLSLRLAYRWKKADIRLDGAAQHNYLTSRQTDFTDINSFDYRIALRSQAELPWGLQMTHVLAMYSRRGYGDTALNTDDFVWNATLTKSFLKNKLIVAAEGFDILGQLSNITQTLNGQGRYETWKNNIPRYGMIRLIYRLDIRPKEH